MKRALFVYLFLVMLVSGACCQESKAVDSLEHIIEALTGKEKAKKLIELNDLIKYSDPIRSLGISKEIHQIGLQQNDAEIILPALSAQAFAHLIMNNLDSLNILATQGRDLALQENNDTQLQRFYELLTHYHRYIGTLDSALYYCEQVLEVGGGGYIPYLNLGSVHFDMGSYAEALKYLNLAREVAIEENNSTYLAGVYNLLSDLYLVLDNSEKAIESAEKFLSLIREQDHTQGVLLALSILAGIEDYNIEKRKQCIKEGLLISEEYKQSDYRTRFKVEYANILFEEGKYDEARDSLLILYENSETDFRVAGPPITKLLSKIYLELGDLERARKYALEAVNLSKSKGRSKTRWGYETLMAIYSEMKEYKKYHDLTIEYLPYKDSIENQERIKGLAFLQAQLEDSEKEKEIYQLNQDLVISKERRNRLVFAGIVTLVILLLILYFRNKQAQVQKKAAKKLELSNQKLQELDKMKGRFFANVSHELRTPLSLIKGPASRLISNGNLTGENLELAEIISTHTKILERRVNEILDLAKLDAQKLKVEKKPTEVIEFSRRILSSFESSAHQSNITVRFSSSLSRLGASLDVKKVEMVLQNYLTNAIKFTPQHGEIELFVELVDHQIIWQVKDSGRGIPEHEIERVFQRFYQVSTASAAEGGSGIGLALASELAQVMGGKVWAQSQLAEGSSFFLSLPYTAVDIPASNEEEQEMENISIVSPKLIDKGGEILLVEDNLDLQKYISRIISPMRVNIANNGIEALEILKTNRPNLIISDIMMPEMDGFELLDRLKKNEELQNIPIVMLTARAGIEDKLKALRIGVDDYLLKPFDESELLARINNILEREGNKENQVADDATNKEILHPNQVWLAELESIISNNKNWDSFTLEDIADAMHLSKRQLQRRIKTYTGLTASNYVRDIRLHQARLLLESGRFETVAEVSYAVGFEHAAHFSKIYAQRYGKRPIDYLK